jgi:segregation and condensation protein B
VNFDHIKLSIEAVLFTSHAPLDAGEIRLYLGEVSLSDVRMGLRALSREYESRAFELVEIENKYQIRTRAEFMDVVKKQHTDKPRTLSKNAFETLAIIAYRQPVTKAQVNALRQLDSSSIIQSLREKGLIYVSGTKKEVGNPMEYRTTEKFLEVFGLKSLSELPSLRSLQMNLDEQKHAAEVLKTLNEHTADPLLSETIDDGELQREEKVIEAVL